jgi:hypothetical protein
MNTIHQIVKKNEYPITIIDKLNEQIINKNLNNIQNNLQIQQNSNKKWIAFEYHSPIIKKITNIFRNTNLHITYRVSNTTHKLLKIYHRNKDIYTNSGIYIVCQKRMERKILRISTKDRIRNEDVRNS